ncbi:MAG: MarR family transcriptional regulator [Planctomycetota bacterium]|nr:MAG: MarR family transcriptional regulator [Planctomycetota bacterium]
MDSRLDLEDQIVAALRQIMRAVDLHSRQLTESCGLTGPQLATLREAERLGPLPGGALARAVHLSPATLSGILNRLESRGLLARRRGESDRRMILVEITAAGRKVLASAPSLLQDHFREELERLASWEREMTLAVLQRVASLMGAEALDAAPHLATGTQLAPQVDGDVDTHAAKSASTRRRPRSSPRNKPPRSDAH